MIVAPLRERAHLVIAYLELKNFTNFLGWQENWSICNFKCLTQLNSSQPGWTQNSIVDIRCQYHPFYHSGDIPTRYHKHVMPSQTLILTISTVALIWDMALFPHKKEPLVTTLLWEILVCHQRPEITRNGNKQMLL